MSGTINLNLVEPTIFHREYENDLGKTHSKSKSVIDQYARVTKVALPFITLYKPVAQPISIILGIARTISCTLYLMEAIKSGEKSNVKYALLQTTIAIVSVASEVFAHPIGMLITTGQDLIINASQLVEALKSRDYVKALEISAHILNNSLHLALFFTGGLEILAASLSVQILLGLYQSSSEFKDGNYLEGCAHLLMAGIRTQQLNTQISIIKMKWEIQSMLEKIEFHSPEEKRTIVDPTVQSKKEGTTTISFQNLHINNPVSSVQAQLTNIIIKYGNNPEGIPMLHYAILSKDIWAVNLLLEQGASCFTKDCNGKTCLYYAVKSGELKLVQLFVGLGLDVNNCNSDGLSSLLLAIEDHKNDIAKYLIDIGTNIDWCFERCCQWGNFEILKVLICNGSKINISENLITTLMSNTEKANVDKNSIIQGKIKCAHFLENLGVISPSHIANKYWLMISVSNVFPEGLEYLLEHGYLSPNQNDSGIHILTPASWSLYGPELVKILISRGADVKFREGGVLNRSLLHSIFGSSKWWDDQYFDDFKIITKMYLDNGLDINQKDAEGLTPLGNIKKHHQSVPQKFIDHMVSLGAKI